MPDQLIEAQQQETVHPGHCAQLAGQFLRRDLADKVLPTLTQNPSAYRETSEHFRTRQQSIEATLILGNCLYRLQQQEQADRLFEQAAQESRQLKLPTLEALAYFQLGRHALLSQKKYSKAQESLQKLQAIQQHAPVSNPLLPLYTRLLQTSLHIELHQFALAKAELAELNNELKASALPADLGVAILTLNGDYHRGLQQQELSLVHYAEALRLATSLDELPAQIELAENMSQIFEQQGDLKQALHFSELACDQLQRFGNAEWLAQGLIRLAGLNRQANDANLALSLLFNALDIYRTLDRPQAFAQLNLEIGKTYLKLGDLAAARTYLIAARNSYKRQQDPQGELETLVTLSELYLRQKEPEMAISVLENLPAALNKGSPADLERHYLLAQAYEYKGQYLQALGHYKQFAIQPKTAALIGHVTENEQFRDNYLRAELERNVDNLRQQQQQLAEERTRYLWLTAVTTFLIGVLCYVLLQMNRRQSQSRASVSQLKEQLGQAPFSHLPNQYQLHEALALLEKDPATGFCEPEDNSNYHARHFIHISLPALRRLCERVGTEKAEQLQQRLTDQLIGLCAADEQLYQLAESRFLLLQPHVEGSTLVASAEAWSARLTPIMTELQLDSRVVMGLVHFPFLTRCPRAVGSQQVVELSLIALAAADQIAEKCQQTSWVELSAIDCQQAAFFNGVFRAQALRAIDKGLVKVNALHGKHLIDWQQIV